jgi:hypothetical protein
MLLVRRFLSLQSDVKDMAAKLEQAETEKQFAEKCLRARLDKGTSR